MYSRVISLAILSFLLTAVGLHGDKLKSSQGIGDLVVTLIGQEEQEGDRPDGDHHLAVVRIRAENIGKQALCVTLNPKLKATFGLEYSAYSENGL